MTDLPDATRFAEEWIAAWNSHDLDRILDHYSDDFEISTPMIRVATGNETGRLEGKRAVRGYWEAALKQVPDSRFTLREVACGVDSIALLYDSVSGKSAIEIMFFDDDGKVCDAVVHYTEGGLR